MPDTCIASPMPAASPSCSAYSTYPQFGRDEAAQRVLLDRYRGFVTETPPGPVAATLPRCRDGDDQKFMELAARCGRPAHHATANCSNSRAAVATRPFAIVTPEQADRNTSHCQGVRHMTRSTRTFFTAACSLRSRPCGGPRGRRRDRQGQFGLFQEGSGNEIVFQPSNVVPKAVGQLRLDHRGPHAETFARRARGYVLPPSPKQKEPDNPVAKNLHPDLRRMGQPAATGTGRRADRRRNGRSARMKAGQQAPATGRRRGRSRSPSISGQSKATGQCELAPAACRTRQ